MIRIPCVLFVLVATLAAGPSPLPPLPIPPIPPEAPPIDQSAPLPDRDANVPTDNSAKTRLSVQDFRIQRFYQGLGYAPGSHFATSEEKRPIQTPGLSVQVPLQ
jgi:hypothetical protein